LLQQLEVVIAYLAPHLPNIPPGIKIPG